MILREFDLDLLYIENETFVDDLIRGGMSRKDAIHKDYQENWKWKRAQFRLENRCITSMFGRLFKELFEPFKTDCQKLEVECVSGEISQRIKAGNICSVQVRFNYPEYILEDGKQKKKMALELLFQGIRRVSLAKGWDLALFERIRDKIINSNYDNHWLWAKQVSSPNRKYKAQVYIEHEPKSIDLYMIVSEKTGRIKKTFITSEIPDEYFYTDLLGKVKWTSNEQVVLESKGGDKIFPVNING